MAEDVIALSQKEIKAAHLAIDQITADLEQGKLAAKDVPKALQQIQIAFGIGVDKSNILLDRPTQIVGHSYKMEQVEAAMQAVLRQGSVDSTADEIAEAVEQLPEETP